MIIIAQVAGSGTAETACPPSVRLSAVGHKTELPPGWTAARVTPVSPLVDTKPKKLEVVAFRIDWEILPSASVAVRITPPEANAPPRSDPKKFPPRPYTPPVKLLKAIVSVAVLVDSHGLADVPAPKKDVVLTAAR